MTIFTNHSVVGLLLELIILGVVFGLVERIPMEPVFYIVIKVVAVVAAIVLVLQFFGVAF